VSIKRRRAPAELNAERDNFARFRSKETRDRDAPAGSLYTIENGSDFTIGPNCVSLKEICHRALQNQPLMGASKPATDFLVNGSGSTLIWVGRRIMIPDWLPAFFDTSWAAE
jgi:hypothetical protein